MKLKIAIIVHGRFYAFDLARELINQGHDVILFTNYPKKIVEKFGVTRKNVKSFLIHGIMSRMLYKLDKALNTYYFEPFLHAWFANLAARAIRRYDVDVIHCFSGVAEEVYQQTLNSHVIKSVARGSSHINTQHQLLLEEEKRAGVPIEKPSKWIIDREEREYQLCDLVFVLSTFAYTSFLQNNLPINKLAILPLGVQIDKFRLDNKIIEERCQRILLNQPLKILMVGTFSYRKGAIDLVKIAELGTECFQFKFVGSVTPEASNLAQKNSTYIEFIPKQPEFELVKFYAEADIFIFTTIEDGYAVVLSQAQAAGLPILTTTNCSGPDIIVEGETGWILPVRSPISFVERLNWCHEHRQELAQMVRRTHQDFQPRDWTNVASDFATICTGLLSQRSK